MRRLLVIALCATLSACGSSPTQPTEPPIPSAVLVADGDLTYNLCVFDRCSNWTFNVRNRGPGCVEASDLAGTITVQAANGDRSTSNWTLTLAEKVSGVFKPGEVRQARDDRGGDLMFVGASGSYTITVTKQTKARCP